MGKCTNCGKEILYNKFKRYRGKVLCNDCYDTRLERKKQKKIAATKALMDAKEIEKKAVEYGYGPTDLNTITSEEPEKTEDSKEDDKKEDAKND